MPAWLLITCGLPFSGKSTLSGAAAAMLGLHRISVDDQHESWGVGTGFAEVDDKDWLAAYSAALRAAEGALADGQSVIFDSVGHTRKNRYRLKRLADRSNARFAVIQIDLDRAQALARLLANQTAPIRPNVPIPSFERIADEFEAPGLDEQVIAYNPGNDLRTWVETELRTFISA